MLLNSKSINNDILKQASAFFSTIHIQQSLSLLNRGEVTISFKKGSMDRFLIVTGICNDRGDQETKIVYKKRLEDMEGETPFTTTCTCDHWTEEKNCPHGAALLLLILLEEMSNEFENDSSICIKPHFCPFRIIFADVYFGVLTPILTKFFVTNSE